MAFYQGSVQQASLIDVLIQKLTSTPVGADAPYWQAVQSGTYANEGYVLKSTGKTGNDKIFIRIKTGAYFVELSAMEDYQPNSTIGITGTSTNETYKSKICWSTDTAYNPAFPVYYWLSFDQNKIMLAVWGDKTYVNWCKTFAWIGMPDRLNPNDDVTAIAFAFSRFAQENAGFTPGRVVGGGPYSKLKVLRDRTKAAQVIYDIVSLGNWKSKGWGDTILLPEMFFGNVNEGIRARIDNVYPIYQPSSYDDFRDGDEITIGSRRFTIMNCGSTTSTHVNCFPSNWLAVEQLS